MSARQTLHNLPTTLAQRLQVLRERKYFSQVGLAEAANVPLSLVRDIEAGLVLFLSASQRQKLARVLVVSPSIIKAVEVAPLQPHQEEEQWLALLIQMRHDPHQPYPCPSCGKPLVVRHFYREDLAGSPLTEVKTHCSACLFKAHHTFSG